MSKRCLGAPSGHRFAVLSTFALTVFAGCSSDGGALEQQLPYESAGGVIGAGGAGLVATGGVQNGGVPNPGAFGGGNTGGAQQGSGGIGSGGIAGSGGIVGSGGVPTGGTAGMGGAVGTGEYPKDICWKHLAHAPGGANKYSVQPGEFYANFALKTPYTKEARGLTFKPIIDNTKVIHHWLLFEVINGTRQDGAIAVGFGLHPDSQLVTGWAPGGDPPDMPPGVGMQLPKPGGYYELEIHYYNTLGEPADDQSGLEVCATYAETKDTATITWLGTESINAPMNRQATAVGTCNPQNPQKRDINIIASVPHMHKIGTHMKTVVNRAGGPVTLIDQPFSFLDQKTYVTPFTLKAGETLTTTCTFENKPPSKLDPVLFGPGSDSEMCYNFVLAYPANALSHPGFSLEGSQNTCLW
jgi:hypothetical protein